MQLTTLPGTEITPTLSPDGQHVAFSWSGVTQDNEDIYVQRVGSGSEVRRTFHAAHDFSPAWSPDGQWIAFLRGRIPGRSEVMLVSPLGGEERSIGQIDIRPTYAFPPYVGWFPDGEALVVVHSPQDRPTALFALSIETREMQAVTTPPVSVEYDLAPAVSADGRSIVFRRGPDLLVADIGDGRRAMSPRLLGATAGRGPFAWTPDSSQIIYANERRLWRVAASGERPPSPVPIVGLDASMPALSRSGTAESNRWCMCR